MFVYWTDPHACPKNDGTCFCYTLLHIVLATLHRPSSSAYNYQEVRYFLVTPEKSEAGSKKSLQTTSLGYSIAKSTLKTPLTFSEVEKTKHENFHCVHLLSSFFFFLLSSSFPSGTTQNYTVRANTKHTKRFLC